jgi:hypothetical protein
MWAPLRAVVLFPRTSLTHRLSDQPIQPAAKKTTAVASRPAPSPAASPTAAVVYLKALCLPVETAHLHAYCWLLALYLGRSATPVAGCQSQRADGSSRQHAPRSQLDIESNNGYQNSTGNTRSPRRKSNLGFVLYAQASIGNGPNTHYLPSTSREFRSAPLRLWPTIGHIAPVHPISPAKRSSPKAIVHEARYRYTPADLADHADIFSALDSPIGQITSTSWTHEQHAPSTSQPVATVRVIQNNGELGFWKKVTSGL